MRFFIRAQIQLIAGQGVVAIMPRDGVAPQASL
jgi:hypothetical protein